MSVHYKFKSALEYDTVTFDGLHISVKDLKNAIVQQKRIGRNTDFDLQITNAQTKEVYEDEDALIPKNTSLLIARIPLATQVKSKPWEGYGGDVTPQVRSDDGPIAKAVDLANLDAPEDDKIKAMMSQSTQDYDPSNYLKIRGANQMGAVPPNYRCYKCHQPGHWIKDCPLNQCAEPIEIKKSTGIPRSFMVPVEGPQVPGAMITPNGQYAVPALDHEAYTQKSAPAPPPIEEIKPDIPEDLVCTICSDLLTDAVMIPCCGNSFCDECIRGILLESEEHECPDCHEKDISPGTLIPNRYLRNSVSNFKNNTGYVKKPLQRPEIKEIKQSKFEPEAKPEVETKKEEKTGTIISEADSTEPPQSVLPDDFPEDTDAEISKLAAKDLVPEGPPGVSPRQSPQAQPIKNMMNAPRGDRHRDINGAPRHGLRRSSNDRSPRRQQRSHRSPSYGDTPTRHEERPGTPTVDEPGMGPTPNYPPNMPYNTGVVPPVMGLPQPSVMQGPPPFPPGQPPPGVYPPPPNFRLPPPAYMAPGHYNVPPRPVFDGGRPPMSSTVPYSSYPPRNRGREYMPPRSLRGRTPPGIIDDPLEAFNRMLREKDERERRAKLRKGRSYSRSSSRSVSRSPRRMRSRSPRRRSRSRSFSLSRSRSRSYSAGGRGSPPMRDVSPHPRRRANSRFRSPHRSPHHPRYVRETGRNFAAQNYRYKEGAIDRGRDRDYDRDYYNPSRREYRERERDRDADDYSHYDAYERDRERERSRHKSGGWMPPSSSSSSSHHHHHHHHHQHHQQSSSSSSHHGGAVAASVVSGASRGGGPPEGYYPPPPELQMSAYGQPPNRYAGPAPVRDAYPPYMPKPEPPQVQPQPAPPVGPVAMPPQHHHHHHQRRYEEHIAPPGVEQPPVPGMEPSPRFEDRYAPPPFQQQLQQRAPGSRSPPARRGGGGADDGDALLAGKSGGRRQNRFGSKSPEKSSAGVGGSPVAAVKRVKESEKKRSSESRGRRREESSDREEGRHRRDASDDERTKKSKDKKKRKEKKEAERKKKKEKKDKERKKGEEKEKKSKAVQKEPKKKQPVEEEVAVPQEPKVSPPKSPPAKPMVSKEEATERNPEATPEKSKSPSTVTQPDLYGDLLTEDIDPKVVENYGKIPEEEDSRNSVERHRESLKNPEPTDEPKVEEENKQQSEAAREDDEEKDVLELHSSEADFMKAELEKSDILAPLPEKSKWEMDDEQTTPTSEFGHAESRHEKSGKVTNEVLKRAENAIFAKAINAIRPIEIKKISVDRAKLYSGEKERASRKADHFDIDNLQVTISSLEEADDADLRPPGTEAKVEPQVVVPEKPPQQRLSVKERLGVKVDDLDRIVKVEKNKSRSLSPLSKRAADMTRNYSQAERKVELEERKRHERRRGEEREKERHESRRTGNERREGRRDEITRREGFRRREEHHRERSRDRRDSEMKKAEKRKRSRSRSLSHDKKSEKDKKRIKKDKKQKKEKEKKKHHKKEDGDKKKEDSKIEKLEPQKQPKPTTDKRKPTLDESNFEPDYDLESESEKEEGEKGKVKVAAATAAIKSPISERKSTDSSDSSDSSSEDDRKRKKHVKKAKKKKSKRDSSSSSSDSDSETSDDEKDRKRRKHKKAKKKKKKSRHK